MFDRRQLWIGIVLVVAVTVACTIAAFADAGRERSGAAPGVVVSGGSLRSQPPGMPIGLDYGNTLFGADAAAIASGLDDAEQLGASWVRVDLPWDGIQPATSETAYDWSRFDTLVSAASARGLRLLVTVVDPPVWARVAACATQENCEPLDPRAYAAFAARAAARYAPRGVHDWEIWNEENLGGFTVSADPAASYAALLAASHQAIHHADPKALVMVGGLGMGQTEQAKHWIGAYDFLAAVAKAGGLADADAVGVHPYDWDAAPKSSAAFALMDGAGHSLESVLVGYGHADLKFWITETGAPTAGSPKVSLARQAQLATETLAVETADPHVAGLFWYSDIDIPDDALYYGLRSADGTAKPAFAALRKAIAAYRAAVH
jgi:polysaccharide biosynthesis protein PslG